MQSASARLPSWYRGLAVVVGVISIALAFIVLLDPVLAVATLILLLAFALLVIGIDRLIAGVTGHPFGSWMGGAAGGVVSEVIGSPAGQSPPSGAPPKT